MLQQIGIAWVTWHKSRDYGDARGSSLDALRPTMTEEEILKAFRKALKSHDRVRHKADWQPGTVLGKSRHPAYDVDVLFDESGADPVYTQNLYPEWWPAPAWAKKIV